MSTSNCTHICPSGYYSSKGSTICSRCSSNEYSYSGSENCNNCPSNSTCMICDSNNSIYGLYKYCYMNFDVSSSSDLTTAFETTGTDGTLTTINILTDVIVSSTVELNENSNIMFNGNGFSIDLTSSISVPSTSTFESTHVNFVGSSLTTSSVSSSSSSYGVIISGVGKFSNCSFSLFKVSALFVSSGGYATLTGNSFTENKATSGVIYGESGSSIEVFDSYFNSNSVTNVYFEIFMICF